MALDRDIYWVGKQWAVTGYGMQACDQKQKGKFDIEAGRLWEDGLLEGVRVQKWINIEDFDKALAVARARYPAPKGKATPPERSVARRKKSDPIEPPKLEQPKPEPPKPTAAQFHMQFRGSARFLPSLRIRIR